MVATNQSADAFLDNEFKNPSTFQIDQFGSGFGDKISGTESKQDAMLREFMGLIGAGDDDFMNNLLGGGAGGGGGFGWSGGGGNVQGPKDIRLRAIGDEAQGILDANMSAAEGALELQRGEQNDALLADLFGSGLQRSTVAQDKAGRLRFGQDEALGNLHAQFNQQELDLMTNDADRRTALEQTRMQADAQVSSARSSGAGQAAAARTQAAAQVFGTQARALEALFASQTGFNSNLVDEFSSMASNELAQNVSAHNNLVNAATSNLNSMRSSDAAIKQARIGARAQRDIAKLNHFSQMAALDLERELGFANLNMDWLRLMMGDENADADRAQNEVSSFDKWLAAISTGAQIADDMGGD